MFECDDVSLFRHDITDSLISTRREEFSFENLKIFCKPLEHLHGFIEIGLDDSIEENSWRFLFSVFLVRLIPLKEASHRRGLIVSECDQIVSTNEYIELILDISFRTRIIFRKMEHKKYIIIVRIKTCILICLENCITIEFMKIIFFHNNINLIEWRIHSVEPDS